MCFVQKSESSLCVPWASFYTQRGCHSGTQEVASYSGTSLSLDQRRISAFNVMPMCPLALLGMATVAIPPFAASPCLATRLGQRGMQRHAGQPAAVLAKWWASTKICMPPCRHLLSWHAYRRVGVVVRWRNPAECRPGHGPAIVPGKACRGPWSRPRQGSCRGSSSFDPTWTRGLSIFVRSRMLPGMCSSSLDLEHCQW